MSDRVSPTRPVTHRRRRDRRPRVDRYLFDEVAGVLAAPLVCIVALWGVVLGAAWLYEFSLTQLAPSLGGSLVIAGLVGASRIRAVAMSLQLQRTADFERSQNPRVRPNRP